MRLDELTNRSLKDFALHPITSRVLLLCTLLLSIGGCSNAAPDRIRVATYNIRYLDTELDSNRRDALIRVIRELDADVIGLQEIDDRAALLQIFDPREWTLFIDDDSRDNQDLALAVRRPLHLANASDDLDADDDHFLFPNSRENHLFPNRRDVLVGEIHTPDGFRFWVMVHHAKSRVGGRHTTEGRRVGAARAILEKLRSDYVDRACILLGDFNDNPDDRSLNILESGNRNAPVGDLRESDTFMLNLTQALAAQGHVSIGRTTRDIQAGRINTIDPKSQQRNIELHETDEHTGDSLFDQILVSIEMSEAVIDGSTKVFDGATGITASDHLPVYSDFDFTAQKGESMGRRAAKPRAAVWISGLTPNPEGPDEGYEVVILMNSTPEEIGLDGWSLRDKSGNTFELAGKLPPRRPLMITMESNAMPLNNDGDEVELLDEQGEVRDKVAYSKSDATAGNTIWYEP